jgi:hypothetical protein
MGEGLLRSWPHKNATVLQRDKLLITLESLPQKETNKILLHFNSRLKDSVLNIYGSGWPYWKV